MCEIDKLGQTFSWKISISKGYSLLSNIFEIQMQNVFVYKDQQF